MMATVMAETETTDGGRRSSGGRSGALTRLIRAAIMGRRLVDEDNALVFGVQWTDAFDETTVRRFRIIVLE